MSSSARTSSIPSTIAEEDDNSEATNHQAEGSQSRPNAAPLVKQHSFTQFLDLDIELEFDMGVLDLGHHGKHEFKGILPIFKKYTPPNMDELPKVDSILQGWVRKAHIPWTRDEITGPKSFVKTAIAAAAYFNPNDPITDPAMVGAAGFCLSIIYLDDILDKSGSFGGIATSPRRRLSLSLSAITGSKKAPVLAPTEACANEFTNIFLSIVFDILDGKYATMTDLPTVMPALDPVYKLFFISFEHGVKNLPSYNYENCKHMRKAFLNDSIAALLMKDPEYGKYYTDEVYRMLRPRDGGFRTVMEMLLLRKDVILGPHVRKHPLFKIIMHLSASAMGLTNDLFGLEKEVKDGNDNDNLVLRLARNKSITEAFNEVNEILKNQRKDIELTGDRLMDEFSQDEVNSQKLAEFIDILHTFLDGHVYFSQHSDRYGKFTLQPNSK